jgi:hypothetical protein
MGWVVNATPRRLPARNESLYRLRYPGPFSWQWHEKNDVRVEFAFRKFVCCPCKQIVAPAFTSCHTRSISSNNIPSCGQSQADGRFYALRSVRPVRCLALCASNRFIAFVLHFQIALVLYTYSAWHPNSLMWRLHYVMWAYSFCWALREKPTRWYYYNTLNTIRTFRIKRHTIVK